MAEEPLWIRQLTEDVMRPTPFWAQIQGIRQAQQQQQLLDFTQNTTTYGTGPVEAPPVTGEAVITFHPPAEEIDDNEKMHVRNWIVAVAAGK